MHVGTEYNYLSAGFEMIVVRADEAVFGSASGKWRERKLLSRAIQINARD